MTRVCVYLLQAGVVRDRRSRQFTVSLSPFAAEPSHRAHPTKSTGKRISVGKILPAVAVVMLAVIGLVAIARNLSSKLARDRADQPPLWSASDPPVVAGDRPPPAIQPPASTPQSRERPPQAHRVPADPAGNGQAVKTGNGRHVKPTETRPADCGESDVIGVLRPVTFSPHALERFAERAGLPPPSSRTWTSSSATFSPAKAGSPPRRPNGRGRTTPPTCT